MSETSTWHDLDSADAVAAAIMDVFERRGDNRYDELVTQNEHALQCGALAMEAGSDQTTVAAAFLHDIGHLIDDRDSDCVRKSDRHHEVAGARFLSRWFGPAVTEPIRFHVPAKRYLCATSPGYHAELSAGSVASLVLQGGPMSPIEAAEFEANPFGMQAVDLRRWDDLAKVPGAPTPSLEAFRDLIVDTIEMPER